MEDSERCLETNVARIMKAGIGMHAQLDECVKEQTWLRLASQLRTHRRAVSFPDLSLIILTGILALLAVLLASETLGVGASMAMNPLFVVAIVVLALILATIPVAGLVIVIRRRHNAQPT